MPTLAIANKNYSSWSLRAWLALRHAGIAFDEIKILLGLPETAAEIARYSPSGRLPTLRDGELLIWDSLAICEYAAEKAPQLWPANPATRAVARAAAAEMHSGFMALRSAMPMNLRATHRRVPLDAAILADIERIERLWRDCRQRFGTGGPWLFGGWSIADAMYAPVATRFATYDVSRPGVVDDYVATVFADPVFAEWRRAAALESEIILEDEAGTPAA